MVVYYIDIYLLWTKKNKDLPEIELSAAETAILLTRLNREATSWF